MIFFYLKIHRSLLKDWKSKLKDWKSQFISKESIYFGFFIITISFWSLLIDFGHFFIIRTDDNQFCCGKLKSDFKFGSKKLIKSRFDHNISWNLALDWLDRQCLHKSTVAQIAEFNLNPISLSESELAINQNLIPFTFYSESSTIRFLGPKRLILNTNLKIFTRTKCIVE